MLPEGPCGRSSAEARQNPTKVGFDGIAKHVADDLAGHIAHLVGHRAPEEVAAAAAVPTAAAVVPQLPQHDELHHSHGGDAEQREA